MRETSRTAPAEAADQTIGCDAKVDVFRGDRAFPYHVEMGTVVSVDVADCYGRFPEGSNRPWTGGPNPVTGPLHVDGVAPGDVIAVHLLRLQVLGDGFHGPDDARRIVPYDETGRHALFPGGHHVPLNPHIGTIGVAPAVGTQRTCDAGDHGGNMDCSLICPGCVVCFNAQCPGAGLGIGDVHAVMGDGETGGQGLETAARATFRIATVEGLPIPRPYGLCADTFFIIGWGETLSAAADMAQSEMISWVVTWLGMPVGDALRFLGSAANLRVCWRGGDTPVMRMELPLAHIHPSTRQCLRHVMGVLES